MTERLSRADRSALMRDTRRAAILDAAIEEALAHGYRHFTRRGVALRAGVANGSINHAFGTIEALREAVMREAVARENVEIIRQGLADGHASAHAASPDLKMAALQTA